LLAQETAERLVWIGWLKDSPGKVTRNSAGKYADSSPISARDHLAKGSPVQNLLRQRGDFGFVTFKINWHFWIAERNIQGWRFVAQNRIGRTGRASTGLAPDQSSTEP